MATGKVIGRVEVSVGNVKIVDVDGNLRDCSFGDLMYEGEQIYSEDPNALFQIKYLALGESSAYDGVFRVLADGSVIAGLDGNENLFGDDIDFIETAAGEGTLPASSAFLEELDDVQTDMLGFSRGADSSEYGAGITGFGVGDDLSDQTPPVITSANNLVYDENEDGLILQVTADDTSALTYSIDGLDSGLFDINPQTGELTFKESPDYENPQDIGGDNEYNMYVTVTDAAGNFTTQLISININNLNDNTPTAEDDTQTATEDVVEDINGQLIGGDADGNDIEFVLVDGLAEGEGNLVFNADGSYTYNVGSDFQELAEGETREVTFTYKTSETDTAEDFESEVATVTIVVTGTNDGPVVDGLLGSVQAEVIDGLNVFTGTLSATDVDGDIQSIRLENISSNPEYGVNVAFDGSNYVVSGDFNPLAIGESTQVSFNYIATDDFGADSNIGTVTLTVTGTNDGPIAVADFYGNPGVSVVQGEILDAFPDTEVGEGQGEYEPSESSSEFKTIDHVIFDYAGGPLTIDMLSERGSGDEYTDIDGDGVQTNLDTEINLFKWDVETESWLFVENNDDGGFNDGSGDGSLHSWDSYLSFEDGDLAAGQYLVAISSYNFDADEVFDPYQSGYSTGDYQLTLGGDVVVTNAPDSATIVVNASGGDLIYENDTVSLDVLANDTDIDHGAVLSLDYLLVEEGSVFSIADNKLVFNPGTEFDYLAQGETTHISVEYVMSDEHGAESSATATLTITGTNDAPVLSAVVIGDMATFEDTTMYLHNQVEAEFTDVDERGDMTLVITTPTGEVDYNFGELDVRVDESASSTHQLVLLGSTQDLEALFNGGLSDGHFLKYTPDANSDVDEVFHVELLDEYGASDFFQEVITVDAVSGRASIEVINTSTQEDTAISQDLRVTFTDVDDVNEVHYVSYTIPTGGWAVTDLNGWTQVGSSHTYVKDISQEVDDAAALNGVGDRYDSLTLTIEAPEIIPPNNSDYDARGGWFAAKEAWADTQLFDIATDEEITYLNNADVLFNDDHGSIIVDAVSGEATVSIENSQVFEDHSVSPTISVVFTDAGDMNETHSLGFEVPEGWSVTDANGWVANGDGSYSLDVSSLVNQAAIDAGIDGDREGSVEIEVDGPAIMPPANSDIDLTDLTAMAEVFDVVHDRETDTTNNSDLDIADDGVIVVDAVSGRASIEVINTSTQEDTAVTQDLRVTFTDVDDTNEGHWVSFNVPHGWSVTDANGWTYVGFGKWINDVSAEVDAKADDNGVDGRYDSATILVETPTMLPPANSDYDARDFAVAGVYDVATDEEIRYWNNGDIDSDRGSIIVDAVAGEATMEIVSSQVREDHSVAPVLEVTYTDAGDMNETHLVGFDVPDGWSVTDANGWSYNAQLGVYTMNISSLVNQEAISEGIAGDREGTVTLELEAPSILPPANSDIDVNDLSAVASVFDVAHDSEITYWNNADIDIVNDGVIVVDAVVGGVDVQLLATQTLEDTETTPQIEATFHDAYDMNEAQGLLFVVPEGWSVTDSGDWVSVATLVDQIEALHGNGQIGHALYAEFPNIIENLMSMTDGNGMQYGQVYDNVEEFVTYVDNNYIEFEASLDAMYVQDISAKVDAAVGDDATGGVRHGDITIVVDAPTILPPQDSNLDIDDLTVMAGNLEFVSDEEIGLLNNFKADVDENGEIDIIPVNDDPIALDDDITKVVDGVSVGVDANNPTDDGMGWNYQVIQDANGNWGINQLGSSGIFLGGGDSDYEIDGAGDNERISFSFDTSVDAADIRYTNFDDDDNASYQLFLDGTPVTGKIAHQPNGILSVSGVTFNTIVIYAEQADGHNMFNWTDFQVANIEASYETDVVLPFTIDDTMLLANDTDVDGDTLTVNSVDGDLLLGDTSIVIGSVNIDSNGDVQVTPNAMYEFHSDSDDAGRFEYSISDGNGGTADATAYIDISTGELTGVDVVPATIDSTLVITGSDTLDLSNVSGIDTVVLETGASVQEINLSDVLNATDSDNTLIIKSYDGNAYDQIDGGIHADLGTASPVDLDGQLYAQYVDFDAGATLLIEIDSVDDIV